MAKHSKREAAEVPFEVKPEEAPMVEAEPEPYSDPMPEVEPEPAEVKPPVRVAIQGFRFGAGAAGSFVFGEFEPVPDDIAAQVPDLVDVVGGPKFRALFAHRMSAAGTTESHLLRFLV